MSPAPTIEPFEICTIRPPTENYSITFRLTRNCGWNRCIFCPVYKLGAQFSRRRMDEVKRDVERARAINDLLTDVELEGFSSGQSIFREAARLVEEINARQKGSEGTTESSPKTAGTVPSVDPEGNGEEDERLLWFSSWFKEKPTIEDCLYHVLSWRMNGGQTCFLGDANSLLLSPPYLAEAIRHIREAFPSLRRFTVYGRTKSAARRSLEEMVAYREAGLTRIHFGVESGSDRVLAFMKKGVTGKEHVEGCRKTKEAGISCSVYLMPGLGGMEWSDEHARESATVVSECEPDYVRLRTLEIFPKTGLSSAVADGRFVEATEEQVAREIKTLIENITCNTVVVSDSASNLFNVNGRLPHDREKMVQVIDDYLALAPREKLLYSFSSRFESFMGQYGTVPDDILRALLPYVSGGTVDLSRAPDGDIIRITRLIRSKLMP